MLKYFFASAIIEPKLTKKEIESIKEKQLKENRKIDEKLTPKTTKMFSFV